MVQHNELSAVWSGWNYLICVSMVNAGVVTKIRLSMADTALSRGSRARALQKAIPTSSNSCIHLKVIICIQQNLSRLSSAQYAVNFVILMVPESVQKSRK